MWRKALSAAAVIALAAVTSSGAALAQATDYPDRPIHFVAPYGPGGTVDPTARIIAQAVSELFGQPTVVENRAGAAGSIGTQHVINSDPDGYTVLVHTNLVATEPCLKPDLPYDFLATMKPVMALTETPFVILVHPSIAANDLDELVEYVKAHPGELNFGASGVGSSGHMRGEQFMAQNDVELVFIPYQDGGSTLAALVGNEIQVAFDTLPGSIGMVREGRLNLLAVGTEEPFFLTPDTPTLEDQGYTNLASQWIGAYVPKDTPDDVTNKLAEAMATALETPGVQEQLQNLGFNTVGTGPEDTLMTLTEETQMWCQTIEKAGISIQ
jgi:tripartite-type tricarboxylate transporter receptor subunit TctC